MSERSVLWSLNGDRPAPATDERLCSELPFTVPRRIDPTRTCMYLPDETQLCVLHELGMLGFLACNGISSPRKFEQPTE